ncbi:MAG: 4Fe-4S dicluster domain-containing protein [Candidatus Lokiarchaeota archaeon]|nr:4Fe-4S dicluster domain-containing protein [Candidatus Lokiarchaeota archaeon]
MLTELPPLKNLLVIDAQRCTGCRNCELACSTRNATSFNPARSRIQILKKEHKGLIIPMVCLQCDEPLCAEACPTNAIILNSSGVLTVNHEECIGCGNCVSACIYGGIVIDPVARKAIKCDLCDGDPACITACEYGVISLVSEEKGRSERAKGMEQLSTSIRTQEVSE